ncbi:hypothetical protein AYR66_09195 [Noviherbaspirillum denitrificans]|uniref:Lipoprotein n=2 Tax=Noviherbaspirillum denitrificans TaxID=1968433 RepID=A0A254TJT0_9BURK|nr:hypothetical protein AYR66_09195 [Noviherbaspirillum denitrificans]
MFKKQLLLAATCAVILSSISGCAVVTVAGAAVSVASTAVSVGVTAGSLAVKGVTTVGGAVLGSKDDED